MERATGRKETRGAFFAACAVLLGAVFPGTVEARAAPSGETIQASEPGLSHLGPTVGFRQINTDGFGDCLNTYSWSIAWFKGKLYVGTNRGSTLGVVGDPDFHCTGTDPAADIWRYTPQTDTWELAFKSPLDVPLPLGPPGSFLARDNGFRDMIVFEEADGTEALYVAGVIYTTLFDPRKPRLLRTTDGVHFESLPQDPGTVLGDVNATGFRAMAVYKNRLFVTVGSVIGEGIILEAADPAGGNDNFRQVTPPGMLAFELAVYNDFLYVGSAESAPFTGFNVLKTNAEPTGTPFYDFVPVVTHGAYGPYFLGPNNAILSMGLFKSRLYVGGQTDLIRVNPDDTWELVVGDPRPTPTGPIFPLSGLPAGFANPFTGHLWRMEEHKNRFYVGTWDFSVFLRNIPFIGPIASLEAGFDLWRTKDGIFWRQLTRDGFGNKFNHGVRSLLSTDHGLFLGTVNPWDGTQAFRGLSSPLRNRGDEPEFAPMGAVGNAAGERSAFLAVPERLEAEIESGTTVLSWEPVPDAARYRVLREAFTPNREMGVEELPPDAWIPSPFESIGTTSAPYFRDGSSVEGRRYAYCVRAEGGRGQVSEASNLIVPAVLGPAVTFDRVRGAIAGLSARSKIRRARSEGALLSLVAAARDAAERSDLALSRRWLETLRQKIARNPGGVLDPLAAEDLELLVARLLRRVGLAQSGVVAISAVLVPGAP